MRPNTEPWALHSVVVCDLIKHDPTFLEKKIYLNQQTILYMIVEEKDIRKYIIDRDKKKEKKYMAVHNTF